VADTYPSFELRGLDWGAICAHHVGRVRAAADPLAALQEWTAELGDAHTWVRQDEDHLPYALRLDDTGATFVRVPRGTRARDQGVRAGWRLTAIDGAPPQVAAWLRRTGAPQSSHAYVAGRRLLAGPTGTPRALTATSPEGAAVSWDEEPSAPSSPVHWRRLASGAGLVRIDVWLADAGVDEALDAAFAELRRCERLILDLRANPGGNLVLACRTRARFLRGETELGTIRYSAGGGALSRPFPLRAEPADDAARWPARLVVLTDPLTYSASEDFLLGLQGLEHVLVVGAPSGGGSGRPRSLRLLPGLRLTVSTALTYDRRGRCVEGAGIPVDVPAPVLLADEADPALAAAQAA
jgi:carboxyl-terminal processing protease